MKICIPKAMKDKESKQVPTIACRLERSDYDKFMDLVANSALTKSQLIQLMVRACIDKVVITENEQIIED